MPEPLDQLLREHLDQGGPALLRQHRHLALPRSPARKTSVHREHPKGTRRPRHTPQHARHAAMFHLAADLPTPVVTELLGISPTTASRWAALSARTWAQYTAMRRGGCHRGPGDGAGVGRDADADADGESCVQGVPVVTAEKTPHLGLPQTAGDVAHGFSGIAAGRRCIAPVSTCCAGFPRTQLIAF